MSLPTLTPEQREQALAKAAAARQERAELKGRLKRGEITLTEVIYTEDEVIARMKVSEVLGSLPGVGKVRAGQIMQRCGIAEGRRIRGLGSVQRAALEDETAPAAA